MKYMYMALLLFSSNIIFCAEQPASVDEVKAGLDECIQSNDLKSVQHYANLLKNDQKLMEEVRGRYHRVLRDEALKSAKDNTIGLFFETGIFNNPPMMGDSGYLFVDQLILKNRPATALFLLKEKNAQPSSSFYNKHKTTMELAQDLVKQERKQPTDDFSLQKAEELRVYLQTKSDDRMFAKSPFASAHHYVDPAVKVFTDANQRLSDENQKLLDANQKLLKELEKLRVKKNMHDQPTQTERRVAFNVPPRDED